MRLEINIIMRLPIRTYSLMWQKESRLVFIIIVPNERHIMFVDVFIELPLQIFIIPTCFVM